MRRKSFKSNYLPIRAFNISQGYGLRFLPSYISSLSQFIVNDDSNTPAPPNILSLAEEARIWTRNRHDFIITELGSTQFFRSDLDTPRVLSSFTSMMRHVAFWELGHSLRDIMWESLTICLRLTNFGSIERNDWASTSYEDAVRSKYSVNSAFNLNAL
jgi:hypothetical protein